MGNKAVNFDGKVAIITGAANGIGKQTALTFAEAGAAVAVCDMAEEAGQAVAAQIRDGGGKAAFFKVNVASAAETEALAASVVEQFGKIDILIANAGITRDAQLVKVKDGQLAGKMSEADFDLVIDVNLKGVFNSVQAVAPHMIAQGGGRIAVTSSVVGLYGNFGQTNYAATKAGVIGMMRTWSRELGKRGINVNCVAPGFIATDMVKAMPEQVLAGMVSHTPLGRLGEPEDIANTFLFLASDMAAFVNGAVISVDGGLVLGT